MVGKVITFPDTILELFWVPRWFMDWCWRERRDPRTELVCAIEEKLARESHDEGMDG
jgi:hypothetical protein